MTQETWLVVAVGAGFLLLGVAVSPLGWVAVLHRRQRATREGGRGIRDLGDQLRSLRARLERCEASLNAVRNGAAAPELPAAENIVFRRPAPPGRSRPSRSAGNGLDDHREPTLITVPKLAAAQDRQALQGGLSQRDAAIWDLAQKGASPDVIARATGQPIGQIELILGLRRQLDANRTNIPHASHE
jgi:hypothetical protein